MESSYLFAIAALTSGFVWFLGRRPLGLTRATLPKAVGAAVECLGAAIVFWMLNVAAGASLALVVRGIGLGFVSLYVNTDVSLAVLSLGQALVFDAWRREGSGRAASGA
jgi:hypothetical protein